MPEFRHLGPVAAALTLLLGLLAAVGGGPGFAKPLPPLSIFWQVDSTDAAQGLYEVALTVTARAPFPNVSVALELPEGMALRDGEPRWDGDLEDNEAHTVRVRVHAPAPGVVRAEVTGKTASNVQIRRTVRIDVPEPETLEPETSKPGGVVSEPPATPGIRELPSR
jgi:hypothetical protein